MTNKKKSAKQKGENNQEKLTKQKKRQQNFSRVVQEFISGKGYRPLTFRELATKLTITDDQLEDFKEVLDTLEREQKILLQAGKYLFQATQGSTLRGIIHMNQSGFGFVDVEGLRESPDVFIPKHLTKNAVDGDLVEVILAPTFSEKGPEGKVSAILSRSKSHLAGIVTNTRGQYAEVYVPLLGKEELALLESSKDEPISLGDRVVMEVITWGGQGEKTLCKLSHKIGHISDPSTDIPAAIEEFELRSTFPKECIDEAETFGTKVSPSALKGRLNLKDLETFTIDPDTAKDFDDAVSLSKDENGIYHLGVHIADVSAYVLPGSKLDEEAFLRGNSTYFPGQCIPMLPSVLSDNLCSLKPKVNRLTVSVFMDFNATGEMIKSDIKRTVIFSKRRFTYKEAMAVLEGKLKSPHKKTLELMRELCLLLKKKRYERGSVEFAMKEQIVLVDENGVPKGTDIVEYDITHQLVEEFMLKANETVALTLDKEGKGVPYRVHDEPSSENMRDFALLAEAFGFKVPMAPKPKDIQKLFEEVTSTPWADYLATSYIRRMRLAVYSPENIGHFGLALSHYCHFTSPIRRYVDLIAHRLIFNLPHDARALEKIAERCSERERISAKAEGSVVLLKKYRLFEKLVEEDPDRIFAAIITKIKPFGFFFEVLELMIEGFIHVSEIGQDYYEFDEKFSRLRGVKGGALFTSGQKIEVRAKEILLITCESTFELVTKREKKKGEARRDPRKAKKG